MDLIEFDGDWIAGTVLQERRRNLGVLEIDSDSRCCEKESKSLQSREIGTELADSQDDSSIWRNPEGDICSRADEEEEDDREGEGKEMGKEGS